MILKKKEDIFSKIKQDPEGKKQLANFIHNKKNNCITLSSGEKYKIITSQDPEYFEYQKNSQQKNKCFSNLIQIITKLF